MSCVFKTVVRYTFGQVEYTIRMLQTTDSECELGAVACMFVTIG